MSGFGTRAYANVAVDSGVKSGDPHKLVLMLFDGALEAVRQAEGHLAGGRIADKCSAVGKAIRIVDEGLRVSVDRNAGGELAFRLIDLYGYITMRLLQANLRNDGDALREVARLLANLRDAWAQISPQPAAAPAGAPTGVPAAAPAPARATQASASNAAAPRFVDASGPPARRVTASA